MVMMMLMLMLMVMLILMVMLMLMMVLMIVVVAIAVRIVTLMVMMMLMLMVMLMMVLMIVMMAIAMGVIALMMMMLVMMMRSLFQACKLLLDGISALHSHQQLLTVQLIPGSGYDHCSGIVSTQKRHRLLDLLLGCTVGVGQDDATCIFDLIIEKLAEVFHIHLAFIHIGNRSEAVEKCSLGGNVLHGTDDIRKLANAAGLNEDAVGVILVQHLFQRLTEVANQGAANATTVHFCHLDTGVLHEAAVNTDLAKFIFDQHQLLAGIDLLQKLLDQSGLSRTEKARKNINFRHSDIPSFKNSFQ